MKPPRRKLLWSLGWLGLALIFWLSLAPLPEGTLPVPGSDKVAHFLAWGSLTLWFLLLCQPPQRRWWVLAFILAGGGIEIAQSFTNYRSGDWLDFAANSGGIVLAWWLLPAIMSLAPVAWCFQLSRKDPTMPP